MQSFKEYLKEAKDTGRGWLETSVARQMIRFATEIESMGAKKYSFKNNVLKFTMPIDPGETPKDLMNDLKDSLPAHELGPAGFNSIAKGAKVANGQMIINVDLSKPLKRAYAKYAKENPGSKESFFVYGDKDADPRRMNSKPKRM